MHKYFQDVTRLLTIDDLTVLGFLFDQKLDATFKAVTTEYLLEETQLSSFKLKRSLNRLQATLFIEKIADTKVNFYYISEYGTQALQKSLEGVVEKC